MKKERINWIDIYKGFLIVLVVIGHVISSYEGAGVSNSLYKALFSIIYSFHMACFVFISGFLCNIKNNTSKAKQIKKRMITYGIPYIIFSFIWIVFKMVFSKYVNTTVGVIDLINIFIIPVSFMWYLYALLLMNIVQIIIEKSNSRIVIILSITALLLKPIIVAYFPGFKDLIICDFMSFWFYFVLGHYYGQFIINIMTSKKWLIIISVLLFVTTNCLLQMPLQLFKSYISIASALSGIVLLVAFFKKIKRCEILNYLGNKSLSIYVLQGIVIAATRVLLGKISIYNDSLGIVNLIICTISGIIIPLAIEKVCSKMWKFDFIFYPNKYIKEE